MAGSPLIVAHRGFSGRQPEQTVAAYLEAVEWAGQTKTPLLLECDLQFSADGEVICLHDLTLDRTSNGTGPAHARTLSALRELDFGSWSTPAPTAEQRRLITLAELLDLVARARASGVEVEIAIETKHPNPRGLELEDRLPALLAPYDWTRTGSPVRLLSFSTAALERLGRLLPELERTLLIERTLGEWADGRLPAGVAVAGVDLRLLRADPDYARRLVGHGGRLNVWTVNSALDIEFCLDLGAHLISTDHPDRVLAAARARSAPDGAIIYPGRL